MVDYQKIETFRALGDKKGKAELIKYAVELGVDAKKAMEFDEIVKAIESISIVVDEKPEVIETKEIVPDVPAIVDSVNEKSPEIVESMPAQMETDSLPLTSFGVTGDAFPWAWNMSNISDKYWFSCIDAAQYAELKSDLDTEFKRYVIELIEKSQIPVVVREPRNSMFVHVTKDGINESTVIYL